MHRNCFFWKWRKCFAGTSFEVKCGPNALNKHLPIWLLCRFFSTRTAICCRGSGS